MVYLIADLKEFLRRFREGAVVVLLLLHFATRPHCFGFEYKSFFYDYPSFNMLRLPAIVGKEPLEIFLDVIKMNEIMLAQKYKDDFLPYFNFSAVNFDMRKLDKRYHPGERFGGSINDVLEHDHFNNVVGRFSLTEIMEKIEEREDMQMLTYEMKRRLQWPNKLVTTPSICSLEYLNWCSMIVLGDNRTERSLLDLWKGLGELERLYLRVRACDIALFGTAIADQTWPQPTIAGMTASQVSRLVSLLSSLQTDVVKELVVSKREYSYGGSKNLYSWDGIMLERFWDEIPIPVPELAARALDQNEREEVKKACLNELLKSKEWNAPSTLAFINEFAHFCDLLSKPENHIRDRTKQIVEKEVPLRTVADMVNEMRGELTSLPRYTAYVKMMQAENGNQTVAIHKINTFKLPEGCGDSKKIEQEIRNQTYKNNYCREREFVEREIRLRQEEWQKDLDLSKKPLPIGRSDIKSEKPQTNNKPQSPLPSRRH